MGTNYYVIKKKDFKDEEKISKILEKISKDALKCQVRNSILKEYKKAISILPESRKELFEEVLDDVVDSFFNKIKYELEDIFDQSDNTKIHIGKSSLGWLFNFQIQNKEECSWHNYEQVMYWLQQNTIGVNAKYQIIDEYNRAQSFKEFKDLVDTKQKDHRNLKNPDNFKYCQNINGYRFSEGDFS